MRPAWALTIGTGDAALGLTEEGTSPAWAKALGPPCSVTSRPSGMSPGVCRLAIAWEAGDREGVLGPTAWYPRRVGREGRRALAGDRDSRPAR
jgi:hypothetical protein